MDWLLSFGERHHHVARLLGHAALVRMRRHASEVDAAVRELDEEEHVCGGSVRQSAPHTMDFSGLVWTGRRKARRLSSPWWLSRKAAGVGFEPTRRLTAPCGFKTTKNFWIYRVFYARAPLRAPRRARGCGSPESSRDHECELRKGVA